MPDASTPSSEPAPAPSATLRLMTLNIHKGFTPLNRRFVLPELREAIRALGADVVCLQEVLGAHDGHRLRQPAWPAAPQYEFLADSLWPQQAYGRNAVYTEGHHGNAVLSKFPIVHYANHDLSIRGPERRGMLHCVLAVPGAQPPLHVICLHLSLTEAHRRQQLERLCALIAREVPATSPLVVAGDFNDWRTAANGLLQDGAALAEVHTAAAGRPARSFPARWPLLRLDRIYVRRVAAARPVGLTRLPWSHLSDHVPLAADLVLP
jgi:endonuclease/exonuclease/phosphatase family metal-dependent hydrolase